MRPITISMSPSATDRDGICQSQTPSGASDLTINGALASGGVATLGEVSAVTIYSASDISNRTFTLTGTNRHGEPLSETMTGPNATTVVSLKSYKTITTVAISGAAAGAVEVGVDGTGISRAVPLDIHCPNDAALGLVISGTINVTVQHTFDDPFAATYNPYASSGVTWMNHDELASVTATNDGNYTMTPRAVRLKANSSSGGTATLTVIQHGTRS